MHDFPRVSSAWIVKIIKKDEAKLMRIVHNIDHEHESVECLPVHLNTQSASVTVIKIRPDHTHVDNNKFSVKTTYSAHKHKCQDIGDELEKVILELGKKLHNRL